jgi:HTH-type transcriptional regulator/antitoxin MqsA
MKCPARGAAELVYGTLDSRCETGKTKPPLGLVRLFKLLDRHRQLLGDWLERPVGPAKK